MCFIISVIAIVFIDFTLFYFDVIIVLRMAYVDSMDNILNPWFIPGIAGI